MDAIENFIADYTADQQAILHYFHQLIKDLPKVSSKISYRVPFYYRNRWLCYLNPKKDGGVDLAFCRGNELSNENGLLEIKNRKLIASITFYKLKDIPKSAINEILHEAILLDEHVLKSPKK